jgi:geranylgeranyl pyrophosphate synthase
VDDLVEGKNSMLYAVTLERCSDDQRDYLTTTYGTEMSKEDERTIKSIMRDTGAVEYCTDTFDELITSSRSALHAACLKKEGKKMLQDVLERVTTLLE